MKINFDFKNPLFHLPYRKTPDLFILVCDIIIGKGRFFITIFNIQLRITWGKNQDKFELKGRNGKKSRY